MQPGPAAEPQRQEAGAAGIAPLPLLVAIAIALGVTAYPPLLAPAGHTDHWASLALMAAMGAGFVRGVGFVPRRPLARALLSAPACLAALAAGPLRLFLA